MPCATKICLNVRGGYAALLAVLIVASSALSAVVGMGSSVLYNREAHMNLELSAQERFSAYACVDYAIQRIIQNPEFSPDATSVLLSPEQKEAVCAIQEVLWRGSTAIIIASSSFGGTRSRLRAEVEEIRGNPRVTLLVEIN